MIPIWQERWRAVKHSGFLVIKSDGGDIATVIPCESEYRYAALIAAAPRMLDALREAWDALPDGPTRVAVAQAISASAESP